MAKKRTPRRVVLAETKQQNRQVRVHRELMSYLSSEEVSYSMDEPKLHLSPVRSAPANPSEQQLFLTETIDSLEKRRQNHEYRHSNSVITVKLNVPREFKKATSTRLLWQGDSGAKAMTSIPVSPGTSSESGSQKSS